ncbi:acetyl-CoA carboxylase biotin carboxyl carrier protein subunit [Parabacteroides sp.]
MEKKEKDQELVDFVVTARKYKTTLTAKYKNRPMWHKPLPGDVISHLPGTILRIDVKEGQEVEAGQLLLIHEAMKMQNRVVAPVSGVITELGVEVGSQISKDHLMVRIEPK